jgi:cytochrome c556
MHKRTAIIVGLTAALAMGGAFAADVGAQIKARQDYFKSIGGAMKGLSDEMKKPAPSTAEVQKFTATLDAQAPKLVSFFPAGTGPESGIKTGSKPEIWQQPAEFKKDAADFVDAAKKLNLAAKSGDIAATKTAAGALGSTCKSCHQAFRSKDQ